MVIEEIRSKAQLFWLYGAANSDLQWKDVVIEMDKKAFIKYICALLLFGLNGIVASHIELSSSEIVFLRTMIGSILLILIFLLSGGRFHIKENLKDIMFIVLSGVAMGTSWMFLYEAYQQIGVSFASLLYYCGPVFVMILSPFIFKEKFTLPKVVGFLIVLIGIFAFKWRSMQNFLELESNIL